MQEGLRRLKQFLEVEKISGGFRRVSGLRGVQGILMGVSGNPRGVQGHFRGVPAGFRRSQAFSGVYQII